MKKLIFFGLILYSISLQAQYLKPYFNILSAENGLPEANILFSLQDKPGYFWYGTQNGLVRYDGYQLKQYPMPDDKGNPIVFCRVQFLHEDQNGIIWANVAREGLFCLNRQKGAFLKAPFDTATLSVFKNSLIFSWVEDRVHGVDLILLQNNKTNKLEIIVYDRKENRFEIYSSAGKGKYHLPVVNSIDLTQDVSGRIWVASDSLINRYDPETKSMIPNQVLPDLSKKYMIDIMTPDPNDADVIWINAIYLETSPSSIPKPRKIFRINSKTKENLIIEPDKNDPAKLSDFCIHVFTDSLKRVWFSTLKGISRYNPGKGTVTNFPLTLPTSLNSEKTHIEAIASDAEGNLWMGGYFKGFVYLDTKTGTTSMYKHSNEAGSLPDHNGINRVFFDRTGTLWLNMPYTGIASLDRQKSMLNPISIAPPTSGNSGKETEDEFYIHGKYNENSFFVKDTTSLYIWNSLENSYQKIDLQNHKIYKQISSVISGNEGLIWISTISSGLYSYDPKSKNLKNYRNIPNDSLSLSSNSINGMIEDKNHNLWIGTGNAGICRFNKTTGTFKRYPFNQDNLKAKTKNALDDATVNSMVFDRDGCLLVGTNQGGINRLNIETGEFKSIVDYPSGLVCVTSIYRDSHQGLCVGTYLSGLFLVDLNAGTFKRYSDKDGLLFNSIVGINEDREGNIWTASPRGLSRLETKTNHFTNFKTSIQTSNFNWSNIFKEADGSFQIPVKSGLIAFNPNRINMSQIPPLVIIESVTYQSTASSKDSVFYTEGRQKTELQYYENKISFQFVALHFENPVSNRYSCRLDGVDKDWIQIGTQRTVTYNNLAPGTYTFHVVASNSDGYWNEQGASYSVTILPPWWKTWWAYGIYLLFILAAARILHNFQKERTIRLEREKTQQRELEQAREIEKAYTELKATQSQLIQSEKMASLGELTAGIAHEIQNPLNFVNNFSEVSNELIDEMNEELAKGDIEEAKAIAADIRQNLEKINHHGKRADAIVKGMLQHSRTSSGTKEPANINALADEYLRLAYHGLRAKDKSFNATMKTDFDETIGNINIIPQDIGRVILNLITNAFYAVTEKKKKLQSGFEPTVSVSTKKQENRIFISVIDNGDGIPQKVLDKIFQPFFTTKPTGEGTGLGLSMSYEIVTKGHQGELRVETREGEGSVFTIVLPV
jgi:signal transduction histidine kinase/ligand-binding sensor domain-containing protein